MKRKDGKKIAMIVIAAVITNSMIIIFMPLVAASVTSFTITPGTGWAGAVDSYSVVVNTTGFTSLPITIPAGFGVVTPITGGEELLRVDLWASSGYYGYATITANNESPSTKVDIYANIEGDIAVTTQDVDYSPGGITRITSPFGGASEVMLIMPTDTAEGGLNMSLSVSLELTDTTIETAQFVQNPAVEGDYVFTAGGVAGEVELTGVSEEEYQEMITQPVDIRKIRYVLSAVNEKWTKGSEYTRRVDIWTKGSEYIGHAVEIMYWQEDTKYLIDIDLNETGYVLDVAFHRWGKDVTEIPYGLAKRSLAKLSPKVDKSTVISETGYKNHINENCKIGLNNIRFTGNVVHQEWIKGSTMRTNSLIYWDKYKKVGIILTLDSGGNVRSVDFSVNGKRAVREIPRTLANQSLTKLGCTPLEP